MKYLGASLTLKGPSDEMLWKRTRYASGNLEDATFTKFVVGGMYLLAVRRRCKVFLVAM